MLVPNIDKYAAALNTHNAVAAKSPGQSSTLPTYGRAVLRRVNKYIHQLCLACRVMQLEARSHRSNAEESQRLQTIAEALKSREHRLEELRIANIAESQRLEELQADNAATEMRLREQCAAFMLVSFCTPDNPHISLGISEFKEL